MTEVEQAEVKDEAEAGVTDREKVEPENAAAGSAETTAQTEAKPGEEQEPGEEKKDTPDEEKGEEKKTGAVEEKGSEGVVRFNLQVPRDKVEKEIDEAIAAYAQTARMRGFRQGKAPLEVIKNRFLATAREEVLQKIIQKEALEKVDRDKMRIVSTPTVIKMDYEEGRDLTADIEVEILPAIDVPGLESIEVEIPSAELKLADYNEEKEIDAILERKRKQVPLVDREIRDGDYVMLKYQSRILQTRRMTPQKTAYFLVKEKEEFEIPGLYNELLGKNEAARIILEQTYPNDYKKKPWAGKELEHYITVERVFELVKPELNEAFVKSIGFDDVDNFKKKLKEEFEAYDRKQVEDKKVKFILAKLVEIIPFVVPRSLVAHEVSRIVSQYPEGSLKFKDEEQAKMYLDILKKEAERSLRASLITETIREKYKLEVTNDDLEKEYKTIAEKNNIPLKEVRKAYTNKENVRELKESLLNEQVMGLLKEKIKIKEV